MSQLGHTHIDADLAERLRQMEIVCLVKYQSHSRVGTAGRGSGNMDEIGRNHLGLTRPQVKYCQGRARNFIEDMRELDRARNRADLARYGSAGRPQQVRAVNNGDGTWRIIDLYPEQLARRAA